MLSAEEIAKCKETSSDLKKLLEGYAKLQIEFTKLCRDYNETIVGEKLCEYNDLKTKVNRSLEAHKLTKYTIIMKAFAFCANPNIRESIDRFCMTQNSCLKMDEFDYERLSKQVTEIVSKEKEKKKFSDNMKKIWLFGIVPVSIFYFISQFQQNGF